MLEFVSYTLEEPKYDVDECHQRGLTYASPLRLTLRLIVWDLEEMKFQKVNLKTLLEFSC